MLELTLASWRQHRPRYLATFLAIFLGVGFCAATLSLTAAAKQGAEDTVALRFSKADVVAYPGPAGADGLSSQVAGLPGVAAVSRVDTSYVDVTWPGGHVPGSVQVSELPATEALRWQHLTSGTQPRGRGQVVLDQSMAESEGVRIGTRLTVGGDSSPPRLVTVVGLSAPTTGAAGVSQLFTAPGQLRGWHLSGTSSELDILASSGTSPQALADQVRALAPSTLVETTQTLREQAVNALTNQVDVIGSFLEGFAVISLLVAGLVIANTFRIVIAQRIRDLALLRCVGAERWQVFTMSVAEAGLLGAVAAAAGTAAGLGLAYLVVSVLGHTSVDVALSSVPPSWSNVLLPLTGGLVMAVAAVLSPAWHAARVAPLVALRPAAPVAFRSRAGGAQLVLGVLLGLLGCLLLAGATATGLLLPGLAGGLISFLGVLELTPLVVPAGIRLVGRARRLLPRRWRGGVPAQLAVLDAVRNPRRTAATAAALIVGVTLISMMSVGAASISASESGALDRVTPVDLTVAGGPVPPTLAAAVRCVDGVTQVVSVPGLSVRTSRGAVVIGSLTATAAAVVVRDSGLRAELGIAGDVLVPDSATGQVPGNGATPFLLRSGDQTARVRPTYTNLTSGPLLVAPAVLRHLGGDPHTVALFVRLSSGADPVVVANAVNDAIGSQARGLTVAGGFVQRSQYDRTISVLLLVATALLGVAVLIALVGVGNTLSLSVLERTREHGLLRALGLTTRQLRTMLADEALLIAGSAAVLGTLLGVGYGWAGTLTLLHGTSNHPPTLALPVERLGVIVLVALAAGLIASVLPARRAARLSPTAALGAP